MIKILMLSERNILLIISILLGCYALPKEPVVIYLIGDSTIANFADNYDEGKNYFKTRYPVTGWGQVFQECFIETDLSAFKNIFDADSVIVDDRARGGRSTRTFFQEGGW